MKFSLPCLASKKMYEMKETRNEIFTFEDWGKQNNFLHPLLKYYQKGKTNLETLFSSPVIVSAKWGTRV